MDNSVNSINKIPNNNILLDRIIIGVRVFLGGIFTLSGVGKLINSEDAKYLVELLATEYYGLIEYVDVIVISLTIFELILALLLFIGWNKLVTFLLTDFFLTGFVVVLLYFYLNGYTVESCGCFGAFGGSGGIEATLIRDVILLVISNIGLALTVLMMKRSSAQSHD